MAFNAILCGVLSLALNCQIMFADMSSSGQHINEVLSVSAEPKLSLQEFTKEEQGNNNIVKENEEMDQSQNEQWRLKNKMDPLKDHSPDVIPGHILKKRFIDASDAGYYGSDVMDGYGLDGLYPVADSAGYFSMYDPRAVGFGPIEKRHNSRWSLIHRKLAELNGNNKRDYDKRQDSRWLIIQNKLNQLHNKYSKRGAEQMQESK